MELPIMVKWNKLNRQREHFINENYYWWIIVHSALEQLIA